MLSTVSVLHRQLIKTIYCFPVVSVLDLVSAFLDNMVLVSASVVKSGIGASLLNTVIYYCKCTITACLILFIDLPYGKNQVVFLVI